MPRGDKGEDIGADLRLVHRRSAVGGGEQMGQNIARRVIRLSGQKPASVDDQLVDRRFEKSQCRTRAQPIEPRHELGRAEEVKEPQLADRVEIDGHGDANFFGVATQAIRKYRTFEDVERDASHLNGEIDRRAVLVSGPPVEQGFGGAHHRRRELEDGLAGEYWRSDAPLAAPALALDAQEAFAQPSRQNASLPAVFLVVAAIVQDDAPYGVRLMRQQHMADRQPALHDRLLEMWPGPAFERVSPYGGEEGDCPERSILRLGSRGIVGPAPL